MVFLSFPVKWLRIKMSEWMETVPISEKKYHVCLEKAHDVGVLWNARFDDGSTGTEQRWGAGAELKNEISLFGISFAHALGIAQPAQELFTDEDYDL